MDEIWVRVEEKLDALGEKVHAVDKTLARQEENLKEHMRRTAAAEESLDLLRSEMRPVKRLYEGLKFLFATVGALGTLAAAVQGIRYFFS